MPKTPVACLCWKLGQLGHTTAPGGCWGQRKLAMANCRHLPLERGAHGPAAEKAEHEQAVSQSHLQSDLEPRQTSRVLGKAPAVPPGHLSQPLAIKMNISVVSQCCQPRGGHRDVALRCLCSVPHTAHRWEQGSAALVLGSSFPFPIPKAVTATVWTCLSSPWSLPLVPGSPPFCCFPWHIFGQ